MGNERKKRKTQSIICAYLKEGMFKKDAAILAGISEATLYRWLDEDKSFESRVEASVLKYKHSLVKIVNMSAKKDGRLALEVLRRRFPDNNARSDEMMDQSRSTKALAETIQKMLELKDDDDEEPTGNIQPAAALAVIENGGTQETVPWQQPKQ